MHHDITVHRVVKSSKLAGQYIEPHIHAFSTSFMGWTGIFRYRWEQNGFRPNLAFWSWCRRGWSTL